MKTAKEVTKHFRSLVDGKAVYLWGANCETITEELTNRLHKTYGTSKYNKAYYNGKLKEGAGRIGADCSGSLYPISGRDTTANGYYNRCPEKGTIGSIPVKPCLVFIKQGGKMVHVGWHDGEGNVYEMKDSQSNAQKGHVTSRWTHWGIPDFVDYSEEKLMEDTFMIEMRELKQGAKGEDVKALQILLIGYGHKCGGTGADGIFGANTDKAVRAYQRAKGLTVDGIAGKNTWTSLLK